MGMGLNMTAYDLVIVAIFIFFMARGIWVGLLGQVTVIEGWVEEVQARAKAGQAIFTFEEKSPQLLESVATCD